MIVYRDSERAVPSGAWRSDLRSLAREVSARGSPPLAAARELLIEAGAFEAAVADAVNDERDGLSPLDAPLRAATLAAARLLLGCWWEAPRAERASLSRDARAAVDGLFRVSLPTHLARRPIEGYEYYALYPEAYADAVRALASSWSSSAVCVGVRGIGTGLSAIVSAALERHGWRVHSFSLRPRGHPFARQVELTSELADDIRARRESLWLIADEGPGLSGSSFACVTETLAALGVARERIVLLPSWVPSGDSFVNSRAAACWKSHRKLSVCFEQLWIDSGRLTSALTDRGLAGSSEYAVTLGAPVAKETMLRDLSAGRWRELGLGQGASRALVQPQHERRKYLAPSGDGALDSRRVPRVLLSFAGHGARGRASLQRALRLAAAGWSPAPRAIVEGFLVRDFVDGSPLASDDRPPRLIGRLAEYLAWIGREMVTGNVARPATLCDAIVMNAREGLGSDGAAFEQLAGEHARLPSVPEVAIDARMFPHEWIDDGRTLWKVDGVDHHDDHFAPGPHDVAWDVAMTSVEFGLSALEERQFVERYAELSRDVTIDRRLDFYRAAYLAHRLGYATLAVSALGESADAGAWRGAARRYARLLRQACGTVCHAA